VPAPFRPVTRRTALALGTVGLVGLTGCSVLDDKTPGSPARTATDPDAALVDEAVTRISAAAAVAAQVPALSALHAAHLTALDAEPAATPTASSTPVPATPAQVRRAERDLQAYLVEASVRADSGPLARLFASMSAAVSQQLVVLRQEAS
jgi:hypothetical protein